jgi:hypothetical protein
VVQILVSPLAAWLLLAAAYFCIMFRIQGDHSILGVFVLSIVLSTDIVLHPQISGLWGHQKLGWFDSNASSMAVAILSLALPEVVIIGTLKIKRIYLFLLFTIVIIFSMSVLTMEFWLILILFVFWDLLPARQRKPFLFVIPLTAIYLFHHIVRSLQVRIELWRIGLKTSNLNLFLGSGLNGFKNHFFRLRTEKYDQLKGTYTLESDPHNLLLNALIAFGLIATVILILLFGFILYRRRLELTKVGKFGIAIFFLQSIFNINSVLINLSLLLMLTSQGQRRIEKSMVPE